MKSVVAIQLALLAYHQVTTWFDLYPFNGARNYSRKEKLAEACSNAVLMSLAPIGFGFRIKTLMGFGVVYYFVLFAAELIVWWIPYFTVPSGRWRRVYNRLLAVATSNFEKGDTLASWTVIYRRLHRGTITLLPEYGDRPVPNLEHTILHAWTLVTALITVVAYRGVLR
jgi:hypothetical protein